MDNNIKQTGTWRSDDIRELYKRYCKLVINNDEMFSTFRRNYNYVRVVGCDMHGPFTLGMFIKYLRKFYPDLYTDLSKFEYLDKVADPLTVQYKDLVLSINTVRYVKVLGDLIKHFKDLDNLNICEIGPGYGGQSTVISTKFDINSYTYIDCVEAIPVIKKYISNFNIPNTRFYTNIDIKINEYDLLIADSSLSEMDDDGFDFYLENVVSKCKKLYMTMNDYYRKETTLSKIRKYFPNILELPDTPTLDPNNECYILISN